MNERVKLSAISGSINAFHACHSASEYPPRPGSALAAPSGVEPFRLNGADMTRGRRCGSQLRRAVEGLRNPEVAVVNFSRATGAGAEVDQTPSARHGIEFSRSGVGLFRSYKHRLPLVKLRLIAGVYQPPSRLAPK